MCVGGIGMEGWGQCWERGWAASGRILEFGGIGPAGGVLSWGRVRREEKGNVQRTDLNPALWLQGPCPSPISHAATAVAELLLCPRHHCGPREGVRGLPSDGAEEQNHRHPDSVCTSVLSAVESSWPKAK